MNTVMNIMNTAILWINSKIAALLSSEYTLIVLEDEDAPLAPGVKHNNTLWVIALCAVCFVCFLFAVYLVKRNRLIRRLSVLRKQNNVTEKAYSFKISVIEEEILELENEIASSIGVEV